MKLNLKSRKNMMLAGAIAAGVVLVAVLVWLFAANVFVKGGIYPRNAEYLNLRGKELTTAEFDAIHKKLPDCEIYWDIPFQGSTYPENTSVLTVSTLTEEDVQTIRYFRELMAVNAMGCTDYQWIRQLQTENPELMVIYEVTIDGTSYPSDATSVTLNHLTDQEIQLLQYLPELTMVDAGNCGDYAQLEMLQKQYPDLVVSCSVKLCGQEFTSDTTELTVTGITDEEADLLKYLPNLTKVTLRDPAMTPEKLFGLPEVYPSIDLNWELDAFGTILSSDTVDVEIAEAEVDVDRLRVIMDYLPNAQSLFLNQCTVDNEAMAALREEKRSDYKVVWTVQCGKLVARTDDTAFMPIKHGVYYFFDEDAYNLRYCEDMIVIDLGHMSIHNVEFVQYMPNLKYLILAHTQVMDITPLQHCKSLLFLELDWSIVRDYTPLLGCTALEDLNLGKTYADVTPLTKMTWLKHLWIIDRGAEAQYTLAQAFKDTDTVLMLDATATVAGGWRELPNYYAMRDALGMEYMVW